MTFPDGRVLKFKRDIGYYKGFPYVDLENLQDHIIITHKSVLLKKKLLSKLKSIMEIPKKQGFTLVQNVNTNMKGFTKQDLQGGYLVCKAQLVLVHPSDKLSCKW